MTPQLAAPQIEAALLAEQRERLAIAREKPEPVDVCDEARNHAVATVATYTAGWTMEADFVTGLALDLAVYRVASTLFGEVSADQKTNYERAWRVLEEVRDGKFPGATRASTTARVLYGGKTNILAATTEEETE
jgi:hypothetical protein